MGSAKRRRGERLYKRGDVWWCRVRNRAGRIVRKSTHAVDREAALDAAAEYERAAASSDHAAASETTLLRCVNDYLADLVRRGRSEATIAIAQQKTGHMLRLWGKRFRMGRVTARVVTEYIDKRLSEGAVRFTVKKELGHLGQVLRLARYHRLYHLEVDQVLPPFFSGGHRPRSRWLTPVEAQALLGELDRWRAAHVAFILATGARKSEAFRARRADVDLERRIVRIRGSKTEGADAEIPITPVTEAAVAFALERAPGRDVLFRSWDNMGRDLKAACVRAGIAPCSPNDLRRTFGHWHRAAGVPVDLVAKMLRHATDKLAQTTYARIGGDALSALVNRQLQSASATVSNLYPEGSPDDPKGLPMPDGSTEKTSAPGKNRTCDLRFRKPSFERRSRGTKLGLARAIAQGGVSDLYRAAPETWAVPRVFRIVGPDVVRVRP